jgi:hypothetical protein
MEDCKMGAAATCAPNARVKAAADRFQADHVEAGTWIDYLEWIGRDARVDEAGLGNSTFRSPQYDAAVEKRDRAAIVLLLFAAVVISGLTGAIVKTCG